MDLYELSTKEDTVQSEQAYSKYPEIIRSTLASEKLVREDGSSELTEVARTEDSPSRTVTTIPLPRIVVNNVDEHDDDPPPYTALLPPNHVGWPFDFSSSIPYSVHSTTSYRTEPPLAPFQSSLTSGSAFYPEGSNGQRISIAVPLVPYPIFKYESHRSHFMQRATTDNNSTMKSDDNRSHRHSAVVIAAVVIISLMALSLLVRLVVDKSLWRG